MPALQRARLRCGAGRASVDEGHRAADGADKRHGGAVARNVERGNAQVGGLSLPIFERLVERGTIDGGKVKVLGYSDPLPQYPWAMRSNLDAGLKTAIREAFYSLKKGAAEADPILKPFKADGFAKIEDGDYDIIRDIRKNVAGG